MAEVLEFALDDLVAGHSLKRLVRRGMAFKTDVYEVDGHMVWGATSRILADLLNRLEVGPRRPLGVVEQRVDDLQRDLPRLGARARHASSGPS